MLSDLIMLTSVCVVVPTTMLGLILGVEYVTDKLGNYVIKKNNKDNDKK